MGIPQIIYLVLIFVSLINESVRHGEPKDYEYNIFTALFAAALDIGLLWWGGFFG